MNTTYVESLLRQRKKRSSDELTWELRDALDEKLEDGAKLTVTERAVLHYCMVSTSDGLEEVIEESQESIGLTAAFASKRGLTETAKILADAAEGKPYSEPGSVAADMEGGPWGATDIALSEIDEDLDGAILDFCAENRADFDLEEP